MTKRLMVAAAASTVGLGGAAALLYLAGIVDFTLSYFESTASNGQVFFLAFLGAMWALLFLTTSFLGAKVSVFLGGVIGAAEGIVAGLISILILNIQKPEGFQTLINTLEKVGWDYLLAAILATILPLFCWLYGMVALPVSLLALRRCQGRASN